ncbi:hypothetical protein [Marinobacter sp. NSM]|uniref:hypothetical protein n=1 Tax=Marinobacter sp. NSM TaxID=3458004 RepID=UPI004035451B
MAAVTVEFPENLTLAKLDPALRQLATELGCEIRLGANRTYKVIPREQNIVRLPVRLRAINQPGPGAA